VVLDGAAMQQAVKHSRLAAPGLVVVPLNTWNLCQGFDYVVRDPVVLDEEEFTIIRRLGWKKSKLASPMSLPLQDPLVGKSVLNDSESQAPTARSDNQQSLAHSARGDSSDESSPKHPLKATKDPTPSQFGFRKFFVFFWPTAECTAFVEGKALKKERLVIALFILSPIIDLTVFLLDDALTTPVLVLLVSCIILLPLSMLIRQNVRIKLAGMGLILFLLQGAALLTADTSLGTRAMERMAITLTLILAIAGEGLPGIPSLILAYQGLIFITFFAAWRGQLGLEADSMADISVWRSVGFSSEQERKNTFTA
jgi:hypothetical protein